VTRYAITSIGDVDNEACLRYDRWIADGYNAGMQYLERYPEQRRSPALLLPGAQSMVCCAVAYTSPLHLPSQRAKIAAYALGTDYHEVVRQELEKAAEAIRDLFGGDTRVCVDTAPLRERYWAARAGLGFIGRNNHLIIPGLGSCFFLGEILTTAALPSFHSELSRHTCNGCGKCVRNCPTGALRPDGSVDSGRCISYLTIEHRGPFPEGTHLHDHLYGCDECAAACPHNAQAPQLPVHPALLPRPGLLELSVEQAADMTQQQFSTLFSHSAIKRTKLSGLQRNARSILADRMATTEKK